jgi:peptidoglycan L-alanyl-D-glutamate endopeptidase CwlK
MSRDIGQLHPLLRWIVPEIIERCAAAGLPVLVTDGFRSQAEQDALYAKGRTAPGRIVTQVRWPNSAHCWGVAFDFCRNIKGREYDDSDNFFGRVAAIAKPYGLDWGGDWRTFKDRPHLQLREFMPDGTTAWLVKNYGTPDRFRATWSSATADPKKEASTVERYKTVLDAPDYARGTLLRLMEAGILLGDGNVDQYHRVIDLSEDQVRILVMLERAGVFERE